MVKVKKDKTTAKRQQWLSRTALALGASESSVEPLLCISRQQSVRINTLKISPQEAVSRLRAIGWSGSAFDWCHEGLSINEGLAAIKNSDLAADGLIYVQNAASWIPVIALDAKAGESVLDICAAPGGKTSHIAAYSNNLAHITANDNSRPRLAKLQSNLTRLGASVETYTLFDAAQLYAKLDGLQFDKILLDAPCSGEGMMSFDNDKDFASWSVAHIKRLQQLQKKLIVQAWQLLKPGGTLVYSTCTMAPEENEAVVDYLLRKNDNAMVRQIPITLSNRVPAVLSWNDKTYRRELSFSMRLIPSPEVEAFYVCKLTKLDNTTI